MSSKPGIIIATLRTKKEKEQLMKVKKDLRNSSRYKDVYIDHDIPSYHRKLRNNLHTIVTTLGQEKLQIKGSYVYKSEQNRTTAGNERYNSNRDHDRRGTRRDNSNSHTHIEERSLNSDLIQRTETAAIIVMIATIRGVNTVNTVIKHIMVVDMITGGILPQVVVTISTNVGSGTFVVGVVIISLIIIFSGQNV